MGKAAKLDWQMRVLKERIILDVVFDDFAQSMRFLELVTNFLQAEKAQNEPQSQADSRDGCARQVDG